jgi:TRAP-type transport system periplasmic protein
MIHAVGVNAWMKLTPEQQTIFREESVAAGDLMRRLMEEGEADQIKKLEDAGLEATKPDLAPFRALMEPAYQRIADYAGADNVKKFRGMVDEARKG